MEAWQTGTLLFALVKISFVYVLEDEVFADSSGLKSVDSDPVENSDDSFVRASIEQFLLEQIPSCIYTRVS